MGARAEMCELSERSELSMLLHPIPHLLSPRLGCKVAGCNPLVGQARVYCARFANTRTNPRLSFSASSPRGDGCGAGYLSADRISLTVATGAAVPWVTCGQTVSAS
jgi:hypothetical protein